MEIYDDDLNPDLTCDFCRNEATYVIRSIGTVCLLRCYKKAIQFSSDRVALRTDESTRRLSQ